MKSVRGTARRRSCVIGVAVGLWLVSGILRPGAARAEEGESARPKLIVLLAVDQLRRDRLAPTMPGGIGRLLREGRVFADASLNHGLTSTCPGHAVMLTGMNPAHTGIIDNSYINRETWEKEYCVSCEDPAARVLGGEAYRSPERLHATTLGDWLKEADPAAKVYSVAMKDRAAITLGGHHPDGAFWFDLTTGLFTTSRYYMETLPEWLARMNGTVPDKDGYLSTLPERWEHAAGSRRPDDYPAEDDERGRTSGHPLGTGTLEERIEQFYGSPFADAAVLDIATQVVEQYGLGGDEHTDLLALSFPATDSVGHPYGPFSAESEDTLRRLDELIGRLLQFLDAQVGLQNVLVAFTADHGVLALPEWMTEQHQSTCPYGDGRISMTRFGVEVWWQVYKKFTAPFGPPNTLVNFSGFQIYVNRQYAAERAVDPDAVVQVVKAYLESKSFVEKAWTRQELSDTTDPVGELYRNSYDPNLSGDLILQIHRDCLIGDPHGTSHGTPYDYDRDIPLVFFGWGVAPGTISGDAHSVDIAPTLAHAASIPAPAQLDGAVRALAPARSSAPAPPDPQDIPEPTLPLAAASVD